MEDILQVKISELMGELLGQFKIFIMVNKNKLLNEKKSFPLSCLATYSASIAKILDGNVDIILVGDSLGSTLYGFNNTQKVTMNMMKEHGQAVIKNIKKSISVIDMPFKTYETKYQSLKNAKILLKYTKAEFIKLEIDISKVDIIKHLSKNKINVIAHIGVTPQSFSDFKKIKILGKNNSEIQKLLILAKKLELSGAKAVLLECVTAKSAKIITSSLSIPTIGIGASKYCDGQILVFDDLINLRSTKHKARFVKNYLNFDKLSRAAVKKFAKDVKKNKYPSKKYSYQ